MRRRFLSFFLLSRTRSGAWSYAEEEAEAAADLGGDETMIEGPMIEGLAEAAETTDAFEADQISSEKTSGVAALSRSQARSTARTRRTS